MKSRDKQLTVFVAMSGGVDSSVAALLLKEKGFRVVGVFMKPWQPEGFICRWQNDRKDALRVATALNIPLMTWDFSREYGQLVAQPMIDAYRTGTTPNPDVDCNRKIKFGAFYNRALAQGADFIATGHYARIVRRNGRPWVACARDANKDQTYFLWAIPPQCLDRTIFPVGNLEKSRVRAIARQSGLVVADKKDSQGVCFVGPIDFRSFLQTQIPVRKGAVLDRNGIKVGEHDGAAYVTIGQRHGLGLPGGTEPRYVVSKNIRKNTVTVGAESDLYGTTLRLVHMNWFGSRPGSGTSVTVKIRYRTKAVRALIGPRGSLLFKGPVRAISAGQSAALYRGTRLVGGGIIA